MANQNPRQKLSRHKNISFILEAEIDRMEYFTDCYYFKLLVKVLTNPRKYHLKTMSNIETEDFLILLLVFSLATREQ